MTLSGVALGGYLSLEQMEKNVIIEREIDVLDKRLNIIDRAARLSMTRDTLIKIFKKVPDSLEFIYKADEYYTEYASIIVSANLYFGPKTKAAVAVLKTSPKSWVEKDKELGVAFISAMIEELRYNLTSINEISEE